MQVDLQGYGVGAAATISDILYMKYFFLSLTSCPHTLLHNFLSQSLWKGPRQLSFSLLFGPRSIEDGSLVSRALAVLSAAQILSKHV